MQHMKMTFPRRIPSRRIRMAAAAACLLCLGIPFVAAGAADPQSSPPDPFLLPFQAWVVRGTVSHTIANRRPALVPPARVFRVFEGDTLNLGPQAVVLVCLGREILVERGSAVYQIKRRFVRRHCRS